MLKFRYNIKGDNKDYSFTMEDSDFWLGSYDGIPRANNSYVYVKNNSSTIYIPYEDCCLFYKYNDKHKIRIRYYKGKLQLNIADNLDDMEFNIKPTVSDHERLRLTKLMEALIIMIEHNPFEIKFIPHNKIGYLPHTILDKSQVKVDLSSVGVTISDYDKRLGEGIRESYFAITLNKDGTFISYAKFTDFDSKLVFSISIGSHSRMEVFNYGLGETRVLYDGEVIGFDKTTEFVLMIWELQTSA